MSRVPLAVLVLGGCSPRLYVPPADVVGATIRAASDESEIRLEPADAREVYAALQAGEAKRIDEGSLWDTSYYLTFETNDADEIEVRLKDGLELWHPSADGNTGDREVPEVARAILLRYVPDTE